MDGLFSVDWLDQVLPFSARRAGSASESVAFVRVCIRPPAIPSLCWPNALSSSWIADDWNPDCPKVATLEKNHWRRYSFKSSAVPNG